MSAIYLGLSTTDVCILAYQCAVTYYIKVPNSWKKNEKARADWFTAFLERNGELPMTPELTSLVWVSSFNRHNVSLFFEKLRKVFDRHHFQPSGIWNVDATGTTMVQQLSRIVANKGTKEVGVITERDRRELVILCQVVNAAENALPHGSYLAVHFIKIILFVMAHLAVLARIIHLGG